MALHGDSLSRQPSHDAVRAKVFVRRVVDGMRAAKTAETIANDLGVPLDAVQRVAESPLAQAMAAWIRPPIDE